MLALADFRTLYPEFQSCSDTLVQAVLDESAIRIDAGIWGTWTDEGHGLLTAHKLALAPNGQMARLDTKTNETTYGMRYDELRMSVPALLRCW